MVQAATGSRSSHWKHLRTTNPIESTFATVRHRTIRSKGCLSNRTALAMVFKLVEAAQKSWRRLDGHNQLPKIIQGVKFAANLIDRQPTTADSSFAVSLQERSLSVVRHAASASSSRQHVSVACVGAVSSWNRSTEIKPPICRCIEGPVRQVCCSA
jgi:hypothetical protein